MAVRRLAGMAPSCIGGFEIPGADSGRVPRGQLIRTRTLTTQQRADLVGRRVEEVVDLAQCVATHEPPSRFEHAPTDEPERPDEAEAVVVVTEAVQTARICKQLGRTSRALRRAPRPHDSKSTSHIGGTGLDAT